MVGFGGVGSTASAMESCLASDDAADVVVVDNFTRQRQRESDKRTLYTPCAHDSTEEVVA